jgi:hypothetical protein
MWLSLLLTMEVAVAAAAAAAANTPRRVSLRMLADEGLRRASSP